MDLVGLGWRAEIAASILLNAAEIDVVEVILDDFLKASASKLRSLQTLTRQIPVIYHGVGLGLSTSFKLEQKRIEKIARLFDVLAPDSWSEHLAFVRAENIEIGHLAAPPRNENTIAGTLENLERIKKIIGTAPALENIATLMDPPGSTLSESEWVGEIVNQSGCDMLLDLHNLYSNAVNFGFDPLSLLKKFPLDKVKVVHLSGGHWIAEPEQFRSNPKGQRLLDDHVHDVPDVVFQLLGRVAESVTQPLTVIIERDGNYPHFAVLLQQIRRAKKVLKEARANSKINKGNLLECSDI